MQSKFDVCRTHRPTFLYKRKTYNLMNYNNKCPSQILNSKLKKFDHLCGTLCSLNIVRYFNKICIVKSVSFHGICIKLAEATSQKQQMSVH